MGRTTGRVKRLCYVSLLAVMLLLCLSCMHSQDIQEKMRVFYEYDEMFYPETPRTSLNFKTGEQKERYGFEVAENYLEITQVEEISSEYREKAVAYLDIMNDFIDDYITYFKDLYEIVMQKGFYPKYFITPIEGRENLYNAGKPLREKLRKQVFNEYEDIVRIQVSYVNLVAFELAKQIGDDEYATMLVHVDRGYTYAFWWMLYVYGRDTPGGTESVKDGRMRFPYWFYESNLKLRIIKQIVDEENNYYGELSVDVYKLDKYDELFDKDGNPKY